MHSHFMVFATIPILIFANPISNNGPISDEFNDSSLQLNAVAYEDSDLNVDAGNDHDLSNAATIADSIATHPSCNSDASMNDDEPENTIQKRLNDVCPIDTPQASPHPSKTPEKSTTNENSPCDQAHPHYLSCGGWAVTNPATAPYFDLVLNCVPGE